MKQRIKIDTCPQCGKFINKKEVERLYGKYSGVLRTGHCSSKCYTLTHIDSKEEKC